MLICNLFIRVLGMFMIAVSDAVLVLVSATALVAGLYRWQNNLESVPERAPTTQSSFSASGTPNSTNNPNDVSARQSSNTNTSAVNNNQGTAAPNSPVTTELGTQPSADPSSIVNVQSEQTRSIDANQALGDAPALASYTIVSGDSLGRLATRFGTSVRVLQEINGIQGSLIQVGQQIRYPLPAN